MGAPWDKVSNRTKRAKEEISRARHPFSLLSGPVRWEQTVLYDCPLPPCLPHQDRLYHLKSRVKINPFLNLLLWIDWTEQQEKCPLHRLVLTVFGTSYVWGKSGSPLEAQGNTIEFLRPSVWGQLQCTLRLKKINAAKGTEIKIVIKHEGQACLLLSSWPKFPEVGHASASRPSFTLKRPRSLTQTSPFKIKFCKASCLAIKILMSTDKTSSQ